jgi:membrane fusion protein, multidrug efflux system
MDQPRDPAGTVEHNVPAPEPRPDRHRPPREGARRNRPWYRRPIPVALAVLAVVALLAFGIPYYLYSRSHESTDDAFIQADVVPISPKVPSHVMGVYINDNQFVKPGELLVRLDPRDFQAQLAQARANLAAAQAQASLAQANVRRFEALFRQRAASAQDRDNAVAQARTATAQIAQLQAAVQQAELNLSYTDITAPDAGRITQKSVEPGQYAQVGQPLCSIVTDRLWVVANFKETQLRGMRPGEPVTIEVDAYPGHPLKGHVDSVQRGSGAAFSLLPPENATGNYVKVVQRVPVKIVFDQPPDPGRPLGPGMSVVPSVKIG